MPDVHLPHLDEHDGETAPAAPAAAPPPSSRGKSLLKIGLEVALISTGVFLGLAGEQWRENAQHHELAEASLRRFRTEIVANRRAIADVKDYHADRLKELKQYYGTPPDKRSEVVVRLTKSLNPAFLDRTAWDLAVATQSLEYLDADLAYAISSLYSTQNQLTKLSEGFAQAMYVNPPDEKPASFLAAMSAYFSDASYFEPKLLTTYDDVVAKIDRTLGEPASH